MAKRRSARTEPELDDEDDDEYAWQPKDRKKKSKSKSATGKKKSSKATPGKKKRASSTEDVKSSGKRKRTSTTGSAGASGKRKSAGSAGGSAVNRSGRKKKTGTGRSKRLSDDDDNTSSSARRRRSGRAAPPKKKAGPPVALISIVTGTILICLIVLALSGTGRTTGEGRNDPAQLEKADALIAEGMAAFKKWSKAVREGPPATEQAMNKKAREKLTEAIDVINAVLENYQDANGNTLPEYEGYEDRLGEIAPYLVDLEKGSRLGG